MDTLGDAMNGTVTSASQGTVGKAPKKKPVSKKVEEITVKVVDDGTFVITERYARPKQRKGDPYEYIEPTTKTAANLQELDELLDDCFGMSGAYDDDKK